MKNIYEETEAQIIAIEESFEMVKKIPKHLNNPSLQPVSVLPVLPDFNMWQHIYTLGVFDQDPTPQQKPKDVDSEYLKSEAILESFSTVTPFLAYLVPSGKIEKEGTSEKAQEYRWIREYGYSASKGKEFSGSYFFQFTEDMVLYTDINTRVNFTTLSREKTKSIPRPSKIFVEKHFDSFPDSMLEAKEERMKLLMPSESFSAKSTLMESEEEELLDDEPTKEMEDL